MSDPEEDGWIKPADKVDAAEIRVSSQKIEAVIIPEQIEKRIRAIAYREGETFQIGKNGKAIINRIVPAGHKFTVYVRAVIEKIRV